VLGPFLFLIYINDIVDDLDCNIKLFADDTSLYVIFYIILHRTQVRAIGRKFVMSDATPLFLYTGVTCERFQIYGSCPHCNDCPSEKCDIFN
jgi:hypothetical protein